jgi:chromosome partitioning protein
MTKIIAIANQKGGVGKTTTAVSLGYYFSRQGYQVLVMDLDGQGHASVSLGIDAADGLKRLLVDGHPLSQVRFNARENLDIVPNDHTAEAVKTHVMQASFREYLISTVLENSGYDIILLDTPPSTDILHISALVASDYLLIPAIMDFLALESVTKIMGTIASLNRIPSVIPPKLIGVLPTMVDRVTSETSENKRILGDAIGHHMILPPIPRDTKVREASHRGMTIWEYAATSTAAVGYLNGSKEQNSFGKTGGYLHVSEIVERHIKE